MGLESGRRCWGVGRPARSPSALLPPGACAPRHPSCPRRPWACGCRFSRRSLPIRSTFEARRSSRRAVHSRLQSGMISVLIRVARNAARRRFDCPSAASRWDPRESHGRHPRRSGGRRGARCPVAAQAGSGAGSATRTFSRTGRWPGEEHELSCWGRLGLEIGTRTFSPAEWWPAGHSMPRCFAERARARKRSADVFTAREVVGRGVSRGPRRVDGDATRTFSRTLRRPCYPSRSPDRKGAG